MCASAAADLYYRALRLVLCVGAIACCCCSRTLPTFRVPPQTEIPLGAEPEPTVGHAVDFSGRYADDYIVRGILPGSVRRWTTDHPELRFNLKSGFGYSMFFIDVAVHDETFRVTGPVTLGVSVSGTAIGKRKFSTPGDYHCEFPISASLFQSERDVTVALDVTPLWTSPSDGAHLGILIDRAGFR